MPSLIQGRVIYPKIAIPDPQGQNPKEGRPFVVVTINEEIKKGGPIYAVGITTTFDNSKPTSTFRFHSVQRPERA